jgi:glycylpeptide N-tetradecanoyltransferase
VDIDNAAEADALFNLLSMNYVEDNDHMFRFGYPIPFLQWALKPPGWRSEWLIGVRATQSKRLLAFISAVPARIRVNRDTMPMVEINFLCVHKKLRSQKLAPVLILEVTRRVNLTGVYQAVYTAGVELPKPVAKCRYWHRSLNPKKLIEVGFSGLKRGYTMAKTIKEYELPKAPTMAGLRPLEPRDVPQARALVSSELAEAKLTAVFDSDDEFAHWFLPRDGIIYSYVLEREGKLTDFLSFYNLPSTILRHPEHKVLNAAYAYYFANTTVTKEILTYNALILAKETGHDVFNALNLGPNAIKNFDAHKFGIGDGSLHYYLFNWLTPEMNPEDVRLVLM